jgi:hypothetical protein
MVAVNEVYKNTGEYLKAEDIGPNLWTVTIASADMKTWDNGDRKIVLTFTELDKIFPLNVTNARTVADIHGGDTDFWIGRQVMLFTVPVSYEGKTVQGIRIRSAAPAQQTMPQRSQPAPQRTSPNAPLNGSPPTRQFDDRNPPPIADADIPF